MSLGEAISAIQLIKDAISLLSTPKGRKEFAYPNDHFRRIGASLSGIYFPETGILGVLRDILKDVTVTEEHLQRLCEFNDIEEPLNTALENLALDYGASARNSIRQSRIMNEIRGRKMTLRHAIQKEINEQITFGGHVNHDEIARLIEEIEELNLVIEEEESNLRQFI